MAAPTFVQEYEGVWSTTGTSQSTSVTAATNDVLVIPASGADTGQTINTPTGGGLTYTLAQSHVLSSNCTEYLWTAPVGSGSTYTLSFTSAANGNDWGFNALRFSSTDGVGASNKANGTGAPSIGLTTTQANSAVVVVAADWNAVDGASRTWTTVNGLTPTAGNGQEVSYFFNSLQFTLYVAYYPDVGAAGAKTLGLSAPTGQKFVIIAQEVKGTASGSTFLPPRALVVPPVAVTQAANW